MKSSYSFYLVTLVILLNSSLQSQSNYLSNQKVYEFLDRMEVKGYIDINHHQKPFTRQVILEKLRDLAAASGLSNDLNDENEKNEKNDLNDENEKIVLNAIERKELEFFLREYDTGLIKPDGKVTFFERNDAGVMRFLEYKDSLFYTNFYFDGGYLYAQREAGKYELTYWNGLSVYGNIGENLSFDLKFNDFSDKSNIPGLSRKFSKEPGYEYGTSRSTTKTFNYDKTDGNLTYSWNWGNVSLIKDRNLWGTGYNGRLILSDKAPSFPHLRLKLYPTDWLEFAYIHGDLTSDVFDSTTFRNSGGTRGHIQLVPKYYAAHILSVDFTKNLKISLGESVVYSDRFEPVYLVPVLFFRIADHYLSKSDLNSGNAQLFSSVSYRLPQYKSRVDLSVFIDELSISNLFGTFPEAIAFTLGITRYDLFFDNLGLKLEYTRINPFVYEHDDPAQLYYNRGYLMGHWIGGNADQIYLRLSYIFNEYFRIWAEGEYTRKGDFYDLSKKRFQKEQTFLYGKQSGYLTFTLSGEYELYNNLFITAKGTFSNSWGSNNVIKPEDYRFIELSSGVRLGF